MIWLWICLIVFIFIVVFLILLVPIVLTFELFRYMRLFMLHDLQHLDSMYRHKERIKSKYDVIISMTTTPDRIHKIQPTLASLLDQSRRVDAINIYVPYTSMKGIHYIIPDWLSQLKNIHIKRVDIDEGPATKLLPAIRENNINTRIIVVDDDVIYGSTVVQDLVNTFDKFRGKRCITNVGHHFKSNFEMCSAWQRFMGYWAGERYVDFLQGFSGYIVTPKLLPPQIFNYEGSPPAAKFVDDIWISGWLHYNKVPIYQLAWRPSNMPIFNFYLEWTSNCLIQTSNKGFVNEPIVAKWFSRLHNVKFKFHHNP